MEMNNAAEKAIIKTLVVQPARIDSADIETWKSAVNLAKRGNRTQLYNLYDNLLADPVLAEAMESRVESITNAEITFQLNGQNVEAIDDLIDTPEFESLIKEIALQKAWGKSVIDTAFYPQFSAFSFPRKNIRIRDMHKPRAEWRKYIAAKEQDMSGYDYTTDEFIIECGDDDDLGYLWRAAQYVIYKRGAFGDWAQFAEIFGMPFTVGKYNSYDTNTRDQLYEALERIGGKPYAAIPNEANIEIHDNKSSGSNDLYSSLRRACNEEILIAIKGNTMTTLDGSSRAQAQVHEEQQSAKTKADRRYVQRILNKRLVPLLVKRGYPVAGGFFLFPEQGEKMNATQQVELGLKLRNAGIPVADNYFYEITGIPAAEKNDTANTPTVETERAPSHVKTERPPSPTKKTDSSNDKKKEEKLTDTEHGWLMNLFDFFADAPTSWSGADKKKKPQTNWSFTAKLTDSITGKLTLADNYSIDIKALLNQALNELYNNGKSGKEQPVVSKPLFDISNEALQQAVDSAFTPDFGKKNQDFIDEFKHNTAVFAAFKNHHQTKEMVALLTDENGNLRSFREFKKLALSVSKNYNENWLRTEYNTAVRSARAAVNFRKYLESEELYPNLEYVRSTASHPRISHLDYVGTILPIRHEWWDTHMPPSDWNCSCSVRPTDKEPTAVPQGEYVSPVFQNNPGKSAEFVKLKEHPYIKKLCPNFKGCGTNTDMQLSDNGDKEICRRICEIAKMYKEKQKRIQENRKKYEVLDRDWEKVLFNNTNGGYVTIHKDRVTQSLKSKNEEAKFKKEKSMAINYANNGNALEMLAEKEREPSPDVMFNGILGELKKLSSHNNIAKEAKNAVYIKKAEIVLFEFTVQTPRIILELNNIKTKYNINAYYYFKGSENKIYKNF